MAYSATRAVARPAGAARRPARAARGSRPGAGPRRPAPGATRASTSAWRCLVPSSRSAAACASACACSTCARACSISASNGSACAPAGDEVTTPSTRAQGRERARGSRRGGPRGGSRGHQARQQQPHVQHRPIGRCRRAERQLRARGPPRRRIARATTSAVVRPRNRPCSTTPACAVELGRERLGIVDRPEVAVEDRRCPGRSCTHVARPARRTTTARTERFDRRAASSRARSRRPRPGAGSASRAARCTSSRRRR